MGIYYAARLVVGLPASQVDIEVDSADGLGLDIISPYYDDPYDQSLIGIVVATSDDYSFQEIDMTAVLEKISLARIKFARMTGLEGKVFISTYGM